MVGYCDDDDGPNRVKRTLISLKVMLSSCNAVCLYTCICIQKPLFALLNDYLWYDKLWGPSQRVVTLLYQQLSILTISTRL